MLDAKHYHPVYIPESDGYDKFIYSSIKYRYTYI